MRFTEVLDSVRGSGGDWTASVSDDWLQGRTVFGGLQAALVVRAMRGLLAGGAPLRTLQATFASPVPGGAMQMRARVLRAGKHATHVEARIVSGDETLCLATGIFGASRESAVRLAPPQPAVDASKAFVVPPVPGLPFLNHFESRWLRGAPPFFGSTIPEVVIETGMIDSAPSASELHALAIADLPPPVALTMLKRPAMGSTMTWMIELLEDRFDAVPLKGWRVDARMSAARDGYTSQSVEVWGPGGVLAALSHQNMVVFG
jgi:hypothetical protein